MSNAALVPVDIVVHGKSRTLELVYASGTSHHIAFELMRVESPSAEVKGHGPGQEVLQVGKQEIEITALEPVGNYAVKPTFSDGHDSGLFTWEYLYELATNHDTLWQMYLDKMEAAGASRMPKAKPALEKWEVQPQVINIVRKPKNG